jgi:hypothetical protein
MHKYEVEFDGVEGRHHYLTGGREPINDASIEDMAKRLGLWDGEAPFPPFTIYCDGVAVAHGGDNRV